MLSYIQYYTIVFFLNNCDGFKVKVGRDVSSSSDASSLVLPVDGTDSPILLVDGDDEDGVVV
jgi:hypothetical protein